MTVTGFVGGFPSIVGTTPPWGFVGASSKILFKLLHTRIQMLEVLDCPDQNLQFEILGSGGGDQLVVHGHKRS
jgi:hypothetical protein